jgi:hypothetical protein
MGRLEDEIEQLREEIEALQLSSAPAVNTEPAYERYLPLVEHLVRGEEVPEELVDQVLPDEGNPLSLRNYLDVVREMIAEGVFSDVEVEEDSS